MIDYLFQLKKDLKLIDSFLRSCYLSGYRLNINRKLGLEPRIKHLKSKRTKIYGLIRDIEWLIPYLRSAEKAVKRIVVQNKYLHSI